MNPMHRWSPLARTLPLAAALALSACDGGNGFESERLTPSQVDGLYEICELRFVPENAILPPADVRQGVMNLNPPATRPRPSVSLSNFSYDLTYTRKSDNFLQQTRGSASLGAREVVLRLYTGDTPSAIARELLLPEGLALTFQAGSPRQLTAGATGFTYPVRRADYARAAGVSEAGLQEQINGRMAATLASPTCPS
jgi:hypothetical protein